MTAAAPGSPVDVGLVLRLLSALVEGPNALPALTGLTFPAPGDRYQEVSVGLASPAAALAWAESFGVKARLHIFDGYVLGVAEARLLSVDLRFAGTRYIDNEAKVDARDLAATRAELAAMAGASS